MDDETRQTPAAAPTTNPTILEQVRSRLHFAWKPIVFIILFFGSIVLLALWLALAHHSDRPAIGVAANTPDISEREAPPPAPVVTPRTPSTTTDAPPADTPNPDRTTECNGMPCPAPTANTSAGPLEGVATASITPQQDYEQKLKQYQLAVAMASPDDRIEATPPQTQPAATTPATSPDQAKPQAPFPPVTSREQEIGQQRNASYDSATGPQRRLFGGVDAIDARLENQIVGDFDGPFRAMVVNNVWSQDHEACLIPQGAKLIGRYHRVADGDQERLEAEIVEIWMPDGWVTTFEPATVESASGATGLTGKVNHHYAKMFLTAIGISAVGATAQVGNYQYGYGYDPGVDLRNGVTRGAGDAAQQVLGRSARLRNTVTVPVGTLIELPLPHDFVLPDWRNHTINPHI